MSLMTFFCGLFSPLCRCEEPRTEPKTRTPASAAGTDVQLNALERTPSPPSPEETEVRSPS
jgi:hypothetical protein